MQITQSEVFTQDLLPDYFQGTNGMFYRRMPRVKNRFFCYGSKEEANRPDALSLDWPEQELPRQRLSEDKVRPFFLQTTSESNIPIEIVEDENTHTVSVEEDVDLNVDWEERQTKQTGPDDQKKNTASQSQDTGQMGHEEQEPLAGFDEVVFTHLPPSIKSACDQLLDADEKATFLVGSLGTLSSAIPNVQALYDGKPTGPNLFVFVTASFGTGKGTLYYARQLVQPIHEGKREKAESEKTTFHSAQLHYENELQLFKKSKTGEPPVPPKRPANRMHFIPVNSSKTAIIQTIAENEGNGCIFETEADTVVDAVKQDYGNFSDVLRKAYHHEAIGYLRRGNDSEYVEVIRPHLSLVVSSTFGQLMQLIPNAENGLFSRFIFFRLRANPVFKNVFDPRKDHYDKFFSELGIQYEKLYNLLVSRSVDDPVWFSLSLKQQEQFLTFFQSYKDETRENISEDLAGSVNRLGLICLRICMILSVIRVYDDTQTVPRYLECQDQDFDNVLRIIETLKLHALSIYWHLPKARIKSADEEQDEAKLEQKRRCRELHKMGHSYRDIAEKVLGSANKRNTVYRWCKL